MFSPLCHLPAVANRTTDQANIVGDPTAAAANDLGQQTGVENVAAASGMVNPVSPCPRCRSVSHSVLLSVAQYYTALLTPSVFLVQNRPIWPLEVT